MSVIDYNCQWLPILLFVMNNFEINFLSSIATNIGENSGTMNISNLSTEKLQNADLPPLLSARSKYNSMDRCNLTPKTNNKQNRTG